MGNESVLRPQINCILKKFSSHNKFSFIKSIYMMKVEITGEINTPQYHKGGITMATETIVKANLQMVYLNGVDKDGDPIFVKKTYSNLQEEATADDVFAVANSLATLQNKPLNEVNEIITKRIQG